MTTNIKRSKELGGVSMLSVMFFVIFLSILAVSFLRATHDEKQRSLRNELSTAALAAAKAGVEDAKRVLLYCMDPAVANVDEDCKGLETSGCTDIIGAFNNESADNARKQIIAVSDENNGDAVVATGVAGDATEASYKQYYTCLQINRYTEEVEFALSALDSKAVDASASVIIPLNVAAKDNDDNYNTNGITLSNFTLQWHLVGEDGASDGSMAQLTPAGEVTNPPKADWRGPAMMRIEMVAVPNPDKGGTFTFDSVDAATYAVILRPVGDGNNYGSQLNLSTFAPSTSPNSAKSPIENVGCSSGSPSRDGYQCAVNISYNGSDLNFDDNDYYIRLTALYRDTHVSIGNLQGKRNGSEVEVVFNALQPAIDVTGRVGNTYRRLIARVAANESLAGNLFFPEYAIESGSDVCKKMLVDTAASGKSRDLCEY
ncbi:hypothetical protein FWF93_00370 [Candidatus Saccharibacteria bacterium]|nr:hypothetical protein [Candidatus Saccharibacteria bacterium]